MSWARFGAQGSNVYLYPSTAGGTCCACSLGEVSDPGRFPRSFSTRSLDEFLQHIARHVEAGDCVPDGVVREVRAEWAEFVGEVD